MKSIGVDVGGTKIATALVSKDGGLSAYKSVATIASDTEKCFNQIVQEIHDLLFREGMQLKDVEGIGIAFPGKVDPDKGIAIYQNNVPFPNFPLVSRLQDLFATNVMIDNDVYCAALAEWRLSSQEANMIYVTVSTGISCAIVHNGNIYRGNGFAGELGSIFLNISSIRSTNNLEETLECLASGPALVKIARGKRGKYTACQSAKDVLEKYRQSDAVIVDIIHEFCSQLAHATHTLDCLFDAEKIVFGGGVMANHPHLLQLIKDDLSSWGYPSIAHKLNLCHLRENSSILGAGLQLYQSKSNSSV